MLGVPFAAASTSAIEWSHPSSHQTTRRCRALGSSGIDLIEYASRQTIRLTRFAHDEAAKEKGGRNASPFLVFVWLSVRSLWSKSREMLDLDIEDV